MRFTRYSRSTRIAFRVAAVTSMLAGVALITAVALPADATPSITATGSDNYLVPASASPFAVPTGSDPYGVAVSPDSKTVYVTELNKDDVDIINATTGALIKTVPSAGPQPQSIVVSPDGKYVYFTDFAGGLLEELSTATNTVVATYTTAATGPNALAISADGTKLFIAEDGSSGTVEEVTAPGLEFVKSVNGFPSITTGLAVEPNGATVWAVGGGGAVDGWAEPITVSSMTRGSSTDVGGTTAPFAAVLSPDGATLYVANNQSGTVQPITTSNGDLGTPANLGSVQPISIAISPNGKQLWVGVQGGDLFGLDTSDLDGTPADYSGAVNTAYGVAASPDGNRVYAGNYSGDSVAAFNVLKTTVTGPGQISSGSASATFQISVNDGNTPVGDYSGDHAGIVILDSKDDEVTDAFSTLDPTTGTVTITVPTASVPVGSYQVEAAVGDTTDNALSYALADPFVVGTLATTGTDAATPLTVGGILVLLGGVVLLLSRRRQSGAIA